MPIYFSSEDGKNYEYDLGLTSLENKFRFDRETYKSKILSDIDYNDNAVEKYDKVAVFKNTIENYFNRTLKYLNFSSMKEVNNIVSSGITTVNGATFDKYYEASYLSNWKKDIDTLVADATNKFVDGVTGLPNLTSFIRETLYPSPIYFEGITGSYYRNFFNDKNYNVFTNYENEGREQQLSPLVIEEVVKGLSASLTGIGPPDEECLSGGGDIFLFSDPPKITTYKFPTVHMWGFEPSEKIFNFINDPSDQNMLEAFFGAGEDGIIAAAYIAGQTFGSTSQGIFGLPFPILSLTGGVIGQNGETGNVYSSIFVEGSTAGTHIFNMNLLPDGLSSENIEEFTKLVDPWDSQDLERELEIRQEEFNRWFKNYCKKITDNADDVKSPVVVPGIGDPIFDQPFPPGFTGTFGDIFGEFIQEGLELGPALTPLLPILLNNDFNNLDDEGLQNLIDKLNNLGLIVVNDFAEKCEEKKYACENVNWYDPVTQPCGVSSFTQCCNHKIYATIKIDYAFYGKDGLGCSLPERDPFGLPIGNTFLGSEYNFGRNCETCEPPNQWNPRNSPCFVDRSCDPWDSIRYSFSDNEVFNHTFKLHFTGECLYAIIDRLSEECRETLRRKLGNLFNKQIAKATLTIVISIRFLSEYYRTSTWAAGECGCSHCPCNHEACLQDLDCVDRIKPSIILPPPDYA